MKKTAQAAMEFMATYGWALLVVLGAIGALAYFGVLNPGNILPDKCFFGSGIGCTSSAIYANTGSADPPYYGTGTVNAILVNGLGHPIDIVHVSFIASGITGEVSGKSCFECRYTDDGDEPANNMCNIGGDEWKPNDQKHLIINCPLVKKGEKPNLDVTIRYKRSGDKYEKEISGVIQGKAH